MKKNHEHIFSIAFSEEEKKIWSILEEVTDPEVPVLSILDLGIVRKINIIQASL